MKPYYDDGQIAIYHGDCRDILPTLGTVDLVLTDPPYDIASEGLREIWQLLAPLMPEQAPPNLDFQYLPISGYWTDIDTGVYGNSGGSLGEALLPIGLAFWMELALGAGSVVDARDKPQGYFSVEVYPIGYFTMEHHHAIGPATNRPP